MLCCDRIAVSEGIDVNKTSESKECMSLLVFFVKRILVSTRRLQ